MPTSSVYYIVSQDNVIVNSSTQKLFGDPWNKIQLLAVKHGIGSAWWNQPIDLTSDWSSKFFVQAFNGSGTSDGFTFTINGDPRGTNSIGDGGQNLGFFGFDTKVGVRNSYAVIIDMWTTVPSSLLGFAESSSSAITPVTIEVPINLTNNAYEVQISYSASRKALSALIGGQSYEQTIDLRSVVGSSGYLGFTAANGGGTLDTDISRWSVTGSKATTPLAVRGNSIYTIVDGPSWTEAEDKSVKLGGHLVTVNNQEEGLFLVASFGASRYSAFIGLNDIGIEGVLSWADGTSIANTDLSLLYEGFWRVGHPPNSSDRPGDEDYGAITLQANLANSEYNNYGIDIPAIGYLNIANNLGSGNFREVPTGISETRFIRRGNSAYVVVQGPTWEEAEANAVKLGGHLVSINDAAENEWIKGNYSTNSSSVWIGFNDKAKEGTWVWSSGDPIGFTAWNSGEPDGQSNYKSTKNAAHLVLTGGIAGKWQDIPNNSSLVGIAEIKLATNNVPSGSPTLSGNFKAGLVITIDKTPIQDADNFNSYTPTYNYTWEVSTNGTTWTKLTTSDATDNNTTYTLTTAEVGKQVRGVVGYLDGYGTQESVASAGFSVTSVSVVRGNSLYTIVDGPSWTEAEADSVRLGGHLVTINDANENQLVYTLARDNNAGLIGLYDPTGQNKWVWASNQESSYFNWSPEKRPYIGIEKWANISYLDSEQPYTGYWNTHQSGPGMYNSAGIAEIPFVRRGNSAYVSVQGPSWWEAEANAVRLGGHLASIDSADENAWIVSTFDPLVTGNAFIGFSDSKTEGQWIWSDGSPATYTNWHPGEPNNLGEEDFAAIGLTVGDGKWNDWGGSGLVGIAEIPLLPNNLPTGVPLIHGISAPGQVIAIDGAGLQDQDNFSGYIPEYQYSWELSRDGSTWSPLTSADATDKNNTYVILSSDVGSKIRGVVSYVDGYGTHELIASSSVDVEVLEISLSLLLSSVSEDGTTKLLFTFTRSGPVSSAIAVNYTVGGTATLDTDYTGIAATPSTRTVTFAAGSATTTVTVNPTIDTLREFDESVTLTLSAGSGYTIGAKSTATGTIIDDDRNFRLSTLSGLSLLQDDSSGVIRLQRANASSVPVTWGNNTPLTAASFPGWQLLAAAQLDGADSLLWRYLRTGQLHTWTLDQNGRQTSGSPLYSLLSPELPLLEQKYGVDLDADGHLESPNVIVSLTAESRAGTAFFPQSDSLLYREAATDRLFVQLLPRFTKEYHYPTGLLWGGTPILAVDSRLPGWSAIAASSIDGVNTLLWRNQSTDLLATWSFDSLWNAVSGTVPVLASSDGGFALEKVFKIDLNSDGVVGAPFVVLATDGVTSLVRLTSDRRLAVQSSNGLVQPLLWGGSAITEADPRLPGWSAVSAGVVNGVNTVVWRNSSASLLATWSFDSQWSATGGTSPVPFSSPQVWDYETWSKKDLNNDHVIGVPPSGVVSTVGDLWLQQLGPALNLYAFKPGSPTFPLRWGGSQLSTTDPRLSGWSPLAAATINGVNSLLWRYDATGQLTTWSFDANWYAISGTPPVQPLSRAAYDLETAFRSDVNRDGVIGSPHQVISSIGPIDLLTDSAGLLLISRNGLTPISMAWGGAALTVNDPRLTGWTAIAAADRNGSNSLLWRHTNGQLAIWTFDANWNAVSGTAPVPSDSQAALVIEDGFSRDLNGDGVIGEPTSPIERLRYRLQQVAPSSNSRDPFSSVFSGGPTADVIVAATFNDLLTGSDLITGLPLQAGAIDLLDGGTESSRNGKFGPSPGRRTFLLSSITNQPFADDGDAGYVLIRNYDPLNDDLVLASDLPLTTAVRSVAFDGITVSGIGLHIDKNRNGFYDPGDNLIGLLDGITTVPSRLIRLPAG